MENRDKSEQLLDLLLDLTDGAAIGLAYTDGPAMPHTNQPRPAAPTDLRMPASLTADCGAKGLLMGEFFETITLPCPECDDDDRGCEVCSGTGTVTQQVMVSWHTIKAVYKKAADALGIPITETTPPPSSWFVCSEACHHVAMNMEKGQRA